MMQADPHSLGPMVAAEMFAYDAPRVGNEHQEFDSLDRAEQRRFLEYARIAISRVAMNYKLEAIGDDSTTPASG